RRRRLVLRRRRRRGRRRRRRGVYQRDQDVAFLLHLRLWRDGGDQQQHQGRQVQRDDERDADDARPAESAVLGFFVFPVDDQLFRHAPVALWGGWSPMRVPGSRGKHRMNRQAYNNTAALCLGRGPLLCSLQVEDLAGVLRVAHALGQGLLGGLLGLGDAAFLPQHAGQVQVGLAV